MSSNEPKLAVVGMGTMGAGIAVAALANGMSLRMMDSDQLASDIGLQRLAERLERHVRSGLLDLDVEAAMKAVHVVTDYRSLSHGVDIVIEAVPENWEIKRPVLAELSAATDVVIATNTSAFPVDELATSVVDPSRFLGVHFFNPAEWIPGVEVVNGSATEQHAIDVAFGFLNTIGKVPTIVASSPGFLANRLQLALFSEASKIIDEGLATADDIDRVVRTTFGFRLGAFGPFAIADMAGLDVYLSILETLTAAFGERFTASEGLRQLVEQGRFGTKVGAGFVEYTREELENLIVARDTAYARLAQVTSASSQ